MKYKKTWLAIAAVVLTITWLAVIIFGVYGYINHESRISAIENQAPLSPSSDLQYAIDFMKDQMQHLIWILGIIIAGVGTLFAFFGWNTQKSIEEEYKLNYSKLVAAKDTEVFKKQIVFLYKEKDDIFIRFQNEIRDRGFNIKVIQISNADLPSKLGDASIVVYHAKDDKDTWCQGIADWSESRLIHCILYSPRNIPGDLFKKINSYYFLSTSQQIAKLRESLYTLLYLAP